MVMVNIKVGNPLDKRNWRELTGQTMVFGSRELACDFGINLARFMGCEVRLDFSDFTGNCNGNGVYLGTIDYIHKIKDL
jgi:hypothetical protein